jgi:hypothetical protein
MTKIDNCEADCHKLDLSGSALCTIICFTTKYTESSVLLPGSIMVSLVAKRKRNESCNHALCVRLFEDDITDTIFETVAGDNFG